MICLWLGSGSFQVSLLHDSWFRLVQAPELRVQVLQSALRSSFWVTVDRSSRHAVIEAIGGSRHFSTGDGSVLDSSKAAR